MKLPIHLFYKPLLVIFLAFAACTTVDELPVPEAQGDPFLELETERLNENEYDFVLELLKVDSEMPNIWSTYNLIRNHPIYVVTSENEGFFINPPVSEWPNSRIIDEDYEGFENLSLYRNNDLLPFAILRTSGLLNYDFSVYNDFDIFIYNISDEISSYWYDEYKNRNGHLFASVFFHELFHQYQREVNDQWHDVNSIQDIYGYPLNSETLPYIILYFNALIDAYDVNNTTAQKEKILSYYVSINNMLLSLDTTEDNLIRNHGFSQEKTEGAARYVEVFSTLDALDNNTIDDPTHGFKEYVDSLSTLAVGARIIYSFRMFYHTGAGAIHLLKELGYPDVENDLLIPSNTPFDLANSFLNLNAKEMENAIEEAKNTYNWDDILLRSQELLD